MLVELVNRGVERTELRHLVTIGNSMAPSRVSLKDGAPEEFGAFIRREITKWIQK
jgi:hypothetical protein